MVVKGLTSTMPSCNGPPHALYNSNHSYKAMNYFFYSFKYAWHVHDLIYEGVLINSLSHIPFFPGPLAFCKKAVERVNSEKNILNR